MAAIPDAPPPRDTAPPKSIGNARMLADGTLQLRLRGVGDDGSIAEALDVIKPDDARYDGMLKILGPMVPGDSKLIPPG